MCSTCAIGVVLSRQLEKTRSGQDGELIRTQAEARQQETSETPHASSATPSAIKCCGEQIRSVTE